MEPKTLEALKASIAKWERNVEAEAPKDVLMGTDECPLCAMFLAENCDGCPVSESVGGKYCAHTPYDRALDMFTAWEIGKVRRPRWQTAARQEVKFLKSLLPVEA